jgi:cytochrome P450
VEEQGDRLNESELFSMLTLLIVAGHETTVTLIGNAVLALLRNPLQLKMVVDQPEVMVQAVEELLRYDSPVERALTRWVAEDVELAGQQLQHGDLIIFQVSFQAAHIFIHRFFSCLPTSPSAILKKPPICAHPLNVT